MPNPHNQETHPYDWAMYQYAHCASGSSNNGDFDAYMNYMLQKQNNLQGR